MLEWPQGGERIRGKANIIAFRSAYPARLEFEVHRTIGRQDLWVNEYTIRYDGKPVLAVGIMEFQDDKVVRERIYLGPVGPTRLESAVGRAYGWAVKLAGRGGEGVYRGREEIGSSGTNGTLSGRNWTSSSRRLVVDATAGSLRSAGFEHRRR